ncbi:MAG: GAF domain-containing protein [Candidatus Hydrogenedentes bacterium]|nr:GAF domain-containing protein [Candidatus Hydrogenedentota bacterium]
MPPTSTYIVNALLGLCAVLAPLLGLVVLIKNPRHATHRAFALLTLNITLWTVGVLIITHCHSEESAWLWIQITFCISGFFPATFVHFVSLFPGPRMEAPRWFIASLYAVGVLLCLGAFSPWYIKAVEVSPNLPPQVTYGPVFYLFVVCIAGGQLFTYLHLFLKLQRASGIARRQIEHVLLGIMLSTVLASATNVFGPALQLESHEQYGPVFMVLLLGFFFYAIVRYHLLDIWVILSRTTVYAVSIGFVTITFLGIFSLVSWMLHTDRTPRSIMPTLVAALVITFVLQPLREYVQLLLNRTVLKRRYDPNRLLVRASKGATQIVHLDHLLETVCRDISETLGVDIIRVLLVDEKDPQTLVTEYSSRPKEQGARTRAYAELLRYMASDSDPIVLEQLLRSGLRDDQTHIAEMLADLDAYLCTPLRAKSGLIGMLTLGPKTSRDMYTNDDLVVFTALATPLAAAIENGRLYRKLEETNLHLARVLSGMRGGVVAVDIHGTVTTVNDSASEIAGPITSGQHFSSLTQPVVDILRQTLGRQRGITDFETVIPRPGGSNIPVAMSSSCLTAADGELTGAMVMLYDLTQVKRLEQNVQRAHRLSSIGTLAAGMAHEIKNPLVSIKTFTQLLLERYDDPDFRSTFSEVVPNEVQRIDSIVTHLLDFARPKPLNFAPHNLRAIIEEVLLLVENQTRKEDIVVETEFPDESTEVYGDEQQLHQVFLNLVLNAIDAMRTTRGNVLQIRLTRDRMYLRRNGSAPLDVECVKVAVSDTGVGIPQDGVDRVFTPFYTTKETGTGLGLSVVHGIVTEHGGEIDVRSTPEVGATFVVSLPLSRPEDA